jgi:hypothetical protein
MHIFICTFSGIIVRVIHINQTVLMKKSGDTIFSDYHDFFLFFFMFFENFDGYTYLIDNNEEDKCYKYLPFS